MLYKMGQITIFLWPVTIYIAFLYISSSNSKDFILTKNVDNGIIKLSMFLSFSICICAQFKKCLRSRSARTIMWNCLWMLTLSHPLFRVVVTFSIETYEGNKQPAIAYLGFWILTYLFSKMVHRLPDEN